MARVKMTTASNKVPKNIGAKASPGRPKGSPNKTTAMLKDAILLAAERAGNTMGKDGMVSYLQAQAIAEPVAFLGMLGKVLPHTIAGDPNAPFVHQIIERVIVRPPNTNG